MSEQDELTALRKEVAALRAEVTTLRASQPVVTYYPQTCAGAAGPNPLMLVLNTGGANPLPVPDLYGQTFGAAGCAPQPQVLTLNG